jgi:CRISPR-associated protein Csx10
VTTAPSYHHLLITARAPLVFPLRKPGTQFTPSLPYIPGSALWGALGAHLDAEPPVRFSNALPAHPQDHWVRVLPTTAMSCKLHRGFLADSDPPESPTHGVFDTLIEQICVQELQPAALTYDPHCPVCGGRAARVDGFVARSQQTGQLHKRTVQRRILTRVAIDRQRSTAAEGLLYSPIVISEMNRFRHAGEQEYGPTSFLAQVWDLEEGRVWNALEQISRVGARISSGLGQVELQLLRPAHAADALPAAHIHDDLAARVAHFQQIFATCWQTVEALAPQRTPDWSPETWRVFSIGLQSDALLQEQGWQPTALFSAAQLREQTGLPALPVYAQAMARVVGGWNVRWNRPKPTRVGAAAGSVFVFRTQASHDAIIAALQTLEAQGIGQRRAEGFGVVYSCNPFHGDATGAEV